MRVMTTVRNIHFEKLTKIFTLPASNNLYPSIYMHAHTSDKNIIEGFLQGDTSCVSLVSEWIKSALQFHGGNNHLSLEDIAADTTLKLLSIFQSKSFQYESSLKTYVQSIARYTLIDALRRRQLRRQYVVANFDVDPPDSTDIHLQIEQSELLARVVSLIGEGCRDLWKMIFFEGRNYKEIAELLHTTESAIKTRVFRCKEEAKALRNRLS